VIVVDAVSVADRAYVFTTGRIVVEDTSARLLKNPELLRAYLGG
jgi:branched-chain amino acid transport system ATP-binding protein